MEKITEQEICLILDTYMYTNYEDAIDGNTLAEVVSSMEKTDIPLEHPNEYTILKDAVLNPQIGELVISNQSQKMGYNRGTNAATFISKEGDTVYVSYRGTFDGEWMDNGRGLTSEGTMQQLQAVKYFDEVVKNEDVSLCDRVVITGHSKGGNKAQFVTMESDNGEYIDACYSVDGQGHSDEAINKWKDKYSEKEYNSRINKLYAINGENDYVSVLGNCIIPPSHIMYIATPAIGADFVAFHDITRMFGKLERNMDGVSISYSGKKNNYVLGRGELGDFVALISEDMMKLPSDKLDGCADSLMQIAEGSKGRFTGLNGEMVSLKDAEELMDYGLPIIFNNILNTKEGQNLLSILVNKDDMSKMLTEDDLLYVNYNDLLLESEYLKNLSSHISMDLLELEAASLSLPFYLDGIQIKKPHIENEVAALASCNMKLKTLSKLQEKIASLYAEYDSSI